MRPASTSNRDRISKAQRLRTSRILAGTLSYALLVGLTALCWMFGYLDGVRVAHCAVAAIAVNGAALLAVRTGLNLRLPDPSLTGLLIVAALIPTSYAMYHVTEPMARAAFLLMATVAMQWGALAFDARRMLQLGAIVLLSYVLVLVALLNWAPQRVDSAIETLMVATYAMVLIQIAMLGGFIAGLRRKLRENNASLEEAMAELKLLAWRDPLTGLPNRHAIMRRLTEAIDRGDAARRRNDGVCIGVLDVDQFKQVNDRFGHQAGDAVLRLIADTLRAQLRGDDLVGRFGGEEFLLILSNAPGADGLAAAERLCRAVAHLPQQARPIPAAVTVSVGIAWHRPGLTMEQTLGRADQALYQAKHLGRNRVAVWRDDAEPLPRLASA